MKRVLWAIALLLPLAGAPTTYAQSVPTIVTQADMTFGPSAGGDNQRTTFLGPGVNLQGFGDATCLWCVGLATYQNAPGTSLDPSIPNDGIDWVTVIGSLTVEGRTNICDAEDCGLSAQGMAALQNFIFPTNGRDFTVTVPAVFNGPIMGSAGSGPDFTQFALQIPQGEMVLSFAFVRAQGLAPAYYSFVDGEFKTPMFPTPEPGPLGLMGAGLAGILGFALRKRKQPAEVALRSTECAKVG